MIAPPIVRVHSGVHVIRDDLFPGGTKARYLHRLFQQANEVVYASPAEGGAQTALAECARAAGKKATIFVAKRAAPHPRALLAKRLGATVVQITPGHLTVVQARARAYARAAGAFLVPFGVDMPEAIAAIAEAALATGLEPDVVWCAAGSGVLARGLAKAWPRARRFAVQVGREITPRDVAGATIFKHPLAFGERCKFPCPFPADPHYDAKAWEMMQGKSVPGARVIAMWNVTGPAA